LVEQREKLIDWLNAFKADPFSTGADKVDRLLAVLQPLLDEREWKPIESAPKDEFLIGWSASWNRPHQAIFCAEVSRRKRRWAFSSLPGSELGDPPTHWMPLPEPPESKEPK
jgi:hypothetical protein